VHGVSKVSATVHVVSRKKTLQDAGKDSTHQRACILCASDGLRDGLRDAQQGLDWPRFPHPRVHRAPQGPTRGPPGGPLTPRPTDPQPAKTDGRGRWAWAMGDGRANVPDGNLWPVARAVAAAQGEKAAGAGGLWGVGLSLVIGATVAVGASSGQGVEWQHLLGYMPRRMLRGARAHARSNLVARRSLATYPRSPTQPHAAPRTPSLCSRRDLPAPLPAPLPPCPPIRRLI
jgi:hypothetical protein